MSSLVSNLLSTLTRSAPAARAAVPYSAVAKSLVAATLSATTIGFVRPSWFISGGRCFSFSGFFGRGEGVEEGLSCTCVQRCVRKKGQLA